MNQFDQYHKAINFLEGLSNLPLEDDYMLKQHHSSLYLKRMRYFLGLLGHPDRGMKCIHITGTAGKGSVTTMVHEILAAAGKRVGSFTSPFVTTSIEKIMVNDTYIAPHELVEIVEYLKPYIDTAYVHGPYGRPSYFELFVAIAFVYFQRQHCEWVVLEVGLGGRYDATNVIEHPVVTATTNIDYDHTQILGKTLKLIARDKAGIIKEGSTFFTSEQRLPLIKIFADICTEKQVLLNQVPRQQSYREYNQALATAITKYLRVAQPYIDKGIQNARLQCRFEVVQRNPLVILDGAHNRSKIKSTIDNLKNLPFNKLHLIMGVAESKDSDAMLRQIIPLADRLYVTRFQIKDRKCAHPKELLVRSQKYLQKSALSEIFLDPERALANAFQRAKKDDLILVAGSFFLAGELRKTWFSEEVILKKRKSF